MPDSPSTNILNVTQLATQHNTTQHNAKAVSVFQVLQRSGSYVFATNKHDGRGTHVVLVILQLLLKAPIGIFSRIRKIAKSGYLASPRLLSARPSVRPSARNNATTSGITSMKFGI